MNNSPPRAPRARLDEPPALERRGRVTNRNRNTPRRVLNYSPQGNTNTNADRANISAIEYENRPLNKNAVNVIARNSFKVGNRVISYARGKYMKMKDFAMYLRTAKGGRTTLGSFLKSNGNRTFVSPESIRFRRNDVKFYKFT